MPTEREKPKWKTRLLEGGFPGREFDVEFWQEQGDETIFEAAWELIELAEEVKYGIKPAFQRTVTKLSYITPDHSVNLKVTEGCGADDRFSSSAFCLSE